MGVGTCPDEEGNETDFGFEFLNAGGVGTCPDEEGNETQSTCRIQSIEGVGTCPDEEGNETPFWFDLYYRRVSALALMKKGMKLTLKLELVATRVGTCPDEEGNETAIDPSEHGRRCRHLP